MLKICRDYSSIVHCFGGASHWYELLLVDRYLKPDKAKQSKRKTKVKDKTLNPVFNEVRNSFTLLRYFHLHQHYTSADVLLIV